MGFLDALGPLASIGEDIYNQDQARQRQNDAQDKAWLMQKDQQSFNSAQFASRYQTTVSDMQKAGLNPALAYQQGGGSGATSGLTTAGIASPGGSSGIGGQINQARLISANEANINASTLETQQKARTGAAVERNTDADTLIKAGVPALIAAQVVQATSSAAQADAMSKKIASEIPIAQANIANLQSQVDRNKSDVALNNKLVAAQDFLNGLHVAQTQLENSKTHLTENEAKILDPKAKLSTTTGAEYAAKSGIVGDIGAGFWKFLNPFSGLGK